MMTCGQCGFASEQPFTYCPKCGTHTAGSNEAGLAGTILNEKYRVLSELGAGSMGTVYLGEHVALKKKIALKILHRELQIGDEPLQRFQREGIAAGQITHANVIQIFDFDRTEDGTSYLAMEYVEGENLKDMLAREGALPNEVALSITRQLLSTLVEAHRHGVVHRDIKPENLMVVRHDGEADMTLKVLDFGLSKLVDRPLDASLQTMSGRVMGTPLYMAPEQWHGEEVDQRSDLYSVALLLYEMLTGHQPFKGSNMTETLMKSTTEPPPSVLDHIGKHPVPVDLDGVLQKGMAKERDDRFQNATEMLEALDDVRTERVQDSSGHGRTSLPRAKRTRRTRASRNDGAGNKQKLAIAGGVVAIAAILIIWGTWGGGAPTETALISQIPAADRNDQQASYVSLLDEARDLLRTNDIASAMTTADKAARHPIADAESFFVRAEVYRRQKDYDTARLDYEEAARQLPTFAPAIAGPGWLAMAAEDWQTADAQFAAALKVDEKCDFALAGSAAVMLHYDNADDALELLADTTSKSPLLHLYRGEALLVTGKLDEAVLEFVQAKRGAPSLWQTYRGLARAYEQQENYEAAEQQCVTGLTMNADAHGLRALHAKLLLAQDRPGDAITALSGVGRKDGETLVLEGLAEQGRGNGQAAVAAWTKALEQGVTDPAQINLLCAMQSATEQAWAESQRFARQAIATDRQLAKAHFFAGLAAFRLADHSAAVADFERALDLDDTDLVAHHTLGVLYMDYVEQPKKAIEVFEAYVAAGGDDDKVSGWLRELKSR